jgi:hypothetical protein
MIRFNNGSGFIAIVTSPTKAKELIKEMIRFSKHSSIFAHFIEEIPEKELKKLKEE